MSTIFLEALRARLAEIDSAAGLLQHDIEVRELDLEIVTEQIDELVVKAKGIELAIEALQAQRGGDTAEREAIVNLLRIHESRPTPPTPTPTADTTPPETAPTARVAPAPVDPAPSTPPTPHGAATAPPGAEDDGSADAPIDAHVEDSIVAAALRLLMDRPGRWITVPDAAKRVEHDHPEFLQYLTRRRLTRFIDKLYKNRARAGEIIVQTEASKGVSYQAKKPIPGVNRAA